MERRMVRPRVRVEGSQHALTLDAALESCPPLSKPCDLVVIWGSPGSGKTTALARAAEILGASAVRVLDQPTPIKLYRELAYGPVLAAWGYTARSAVMSLQLQPWADDELIEYCLLNHKAACGSIMKRVLAMPDRARLEGIPELWACALDHIAVNDSVRTTDELLGAIIEGHTADWDLARVQAAVWSLLMPRGTLPKRIPASLRSLLRHRPLQLHLQAAHLVHTLTHARPHRVLDQVPQEDLVLAVAPALARLSKAIKALQRVAAGKKGQLHPSAVTLLVAMGVRWRPADGHVPVLDGARANGLNWNGCKLAKLRASEASLVRACLVRADLSRAALERADLSRAELSEAVLDATDLTKAILRGADLSRAQCLGTLFEHADLTGASFEEANCPGARFGGANLAAARLTRADLQETMFRRTRVDEADFTGAAFDAADIFETSLRDAILTAARFNDAKINRSDLSGLHLPAVSFRGAVLLDSDLTGTLMPAADFTGTVFHECGLADIDWEGATLRNADFSRSTFHMGSSRSGLVFSTIASEGTRTGFYTDDYTDQTHKHPEEVRKASLYGADLRGAKVEGVDFYLVDLRKARYDPAQAAWFRKCRAILRDRDE